MVNAVDFKEINNLNSNSELIDPKEKQKSSITEIFGEYAPCFSVSNTPAYETQTMAYYQLTKNISIKEKNSIDQILADLPHAEQTIAELIEAMNQQNWDASIFENNLYPYYGLLALRQSKLTSFQFGTLMLYWCHLTYDIEKASFKQINLFSNGQPNPEAIQFINDSAKKCSEYYEKHLFTLTPILSTEQIDRLFKKMKEAPLSEQQIFIYPHTVKEDIIEIIKTLGFNFLIQTSEPNNGFHLVPSLTLMQESLNIMFGAEQASKINPVLGLSSVDDLHKGIIKNERDFGLRFPHIFLPDLADNNKAEGAAFSEHDGYHQYMFSTILKNHRLAFARVADLISHQRLISLPQIFFREKVIDLEMANYRLDYEWPELNPIKTKTSVDFLLFNRQQPETNLISSVKSTKNLASTSPSILLNQENKISNFTHSNELSDLELEIVEAIAPHLIIRKDPFEEAKIKANSNDNFFISLIKLMNSVEKKFKSIDLALDSLLLALNDILKRRNEWKEEFNIDIQNLQISILDIINKFTKDELASFFLKKGWETILAAHQVEKLLKESCSNTDLVTENNNKSQAIINEVFQTSKNQFLSEYFFMGFEDSKAFEQMIDLLPSSIELTKINSVSLVTDCSLKKILNRVKSKNLDLTNCQQLTIETLKLLKQKNYEKLVLNGCDHLVAHLDYLPDTLISLDIKDCPSFTNEHLISLKQKFPNLKIINFK